MIENEAEVRPASGLSTGVLGPLYGWYRWTYRFCRTKPLGAIGGFITLLLVIMAVVAPVIAPYHPKDIDGPRETLGVPLAVHLPPQAQFPFGSPQTNGVEVLFSLGVVQQLPFSLYQ